MKNLIITQAVKEDLPTILDVQMKAFMEVARIFHLKTMPQIEQTLESITDEFDKWLFLNASIAFKAKPTSFRTYVRNLTVLNILKSGFLVSLRNDKKKIKAPPPRQNDEDKIKIVGSVRAYSKDGTCYIHRLVVLPEYQNNGIGKALMAEVEKRFRSQVTRYELFTGSQDHRNLYLYNQLGYNAFKTEKHNNEISFVYLEKNIKD
jgi:ribosomal protein S18 acetylase RimI-like enzyme